MNPAIVNHRISKAEILLHDANLLLEKHRDRWSVADRTYFAVFAAVRALMALLEVQTKTHKGISLKFKEAITTIGEPFQPTDLHLFNQIGRLSFQANMTLEDPAPESVLHENLLAAKALIHRIKSYLQTQLSSVPTHFPRT